MSEGFDRLLKTWTAEHNYKGAFHIEPGRYIVAECGILLGSVCAVKKNHDTHYVGCDIGFNQLMRPILYDAYHEIDTYIDDDVAKESLHQTIVGNICESGDVLAKQRMLPRIAVGDIIGVRDAGAYGYVMASNYNQRLRPAEVLITIDGEPKLIRRREKIEDLLRLLV